MKYNGITIYSECVELSKQGTKESLKKLLFVYLHGKKDTQKTAKQALKKTRNKKIVIDLIDEQLGLNGSSTDINMLLSLGMSISRDRYIKRYLFFLKENEIDLKTVGFFKNVSNKKLNEREIKQVMQYMIEAQDFDSRFFSIIGEDNLQELIDPILNYVASNGINESLLKILGESNEVYIELLQKEIFTEFKESPYENVKLSKYIDFSIPEYLDFLAGLQDILFSYSVMKINNYKEKIMDFSDFYIRVSIRLVNKLTIDSSDWELLKSMMMELVNDIKNIDESIDVLNFVVATVYLERSFAENILIELYKKTKLYSDVALMKLASFQSQYAYREMLSYMLTSENRKERYKYAVRLMMSYPKNGVAIYSYASELEDERLLHTLDDIAKKFAIETTFTDKYKELTLADNDKVQILPHGTIISEFLFDIAKEIKANYFCAAVGFTFSSGLKMISPLIDYIYDVGGTVQLITGALQNYKNGGRNNKIDRRTVNLLNTLVNEQKIDLYTYDEAFYHGKFYCVSNDENAYILIGSTNISKTAFLTNYELDTLITLKNESDNNQYLDWFEAFKNKCDRVRVLDESLFEDFKWESELDIYTSTYIHRLSRSEMSKRISELTDAETQWRLNYWMQHNPSEIFSDLGIVSLQDYIVFLYADQGLAVFESFIPGNAYYTFKYFDFDELLRNVSSLSKGQMVLSNDFLARGYHISDKDKLEKKIDKLFVV